MINLLPLEEKKKLRREYRVRVTVVALLFVLSFEVLLALVYLPAMYSLYLSNQTLSEELERSRSSLPKDVAQIQEEIVSLKNDLDILSGKGDTIPTRYIDEIAKAKTPGISLTGFSYQENPQPMIVLKGYAVLRSDLTTFRNNLRNSPMFSGADFEAKFLLRESDIDFTNMKILLKP